MSRRAHNSRTGYDRVIDQRVLNMLRNEDEFRRKMDAILMLEEWQAVDLIIDETMSYRTCVVFYRCF